MKWIAVVVATSLFFLIGFNSVVHAQDGLPWWSVQSVDTMKYSRDTAAAKLNDPSFDATIDDQVKKIAEVGATHVAIATPYDEQFLPILHRWVASARKYGLSVWFRGNFSGWEGWFGYDRITRDQHLQMAKDFILKDPDLFVDGDIFTACPECENGGPGDPRQNGDIEGHRLFLKSEYLVTSTAFKKIGKKVSSNFDSMNADVARAIMDKNTTQALGGIVVIDHYVNSPEKLASDVSEIARDSGGKVFLGEFGVPIPDINGTMSEGQQASWIGTALSRLAGNKNVIGLNYWVGIGGSTQIWNNDSTPRAAVAVLRTFFKPLVLRGIVVDGFRNPIEDVKVSSNQKNVVTDKDGIFSLPYINSPIKVIAEKTGYTTSSLNISPNGQGTKIVIEKIEGNVFQLILDFIRSLLHI